MASDAAAWVQAIGSVLAIVISVLTVAWQHRRDIQAERARSDLLQRERMDRLQAIIQQAAAQVRSLLDDPDDPGALARTWRESANNDVTIQLAQVEFVLGQLRSVPIFDIPVGANVVRTLNEVAFAAIAAQVALAKELSEVFSAETPGRVSEAIGMSGRIKAGKAELRAHAVRKAMNEASGTDG